MAPKHQLTVLARREGQRSINRPRWATRARWATDTAGQRVGPKYRQDQAMAPIQAGAGGWLRAARLCRSRPFSEYPRTTHVAPRTYQRESLRHLATTAHSNHRGEPHERRTHGNLQSCGRCHRHTCPVQITSIVPAKEVFMGAVTTADGSTTRTGATGPPSYSRMAGRSTPIAGRTRHCFWPSTAIALSSTTAWFRPLDPAVDRV
jgi:hypothetical protein